MSCKQREAWARDTIFVSDHPVSIIGVVHIFAGALTPVKSEKASKA